MAGNTVLVVGAGIAGLTAARELGNAGCQVVVLEARDRAGGRIWTTRNSQTDVPVELGAEFIHGEHVPTWEVIRELSLRTHEVPDQHWKAEQGSWQRREGFWNQLDAVFERIDAQALDRDFTSFLQDLPDIDRESKQLSRQYVEGFHAADARRIGVQALLRAEAAAKRDGISQFRLHEGYSRLIDGIRAGLPPDRVQVLLRTVVKRIEWRRGRVLILAQTPRGPRWFDGTQAVVTLPLGVLQQPAGRGVEFRPAISSKQNAIDSLAMGSVVKLVLEFQEVFWRNPNFGFIHAPRTEIPTWWSDERGPVLTAWVGGPRAEALSERNPSDIETTALRDLATIFDLDPETVRKKLKALHWHDWSADPFARGAYSYTPAGMISMSNELALPVEGTLFFGGEATVEAGEQGTVHAALFSGQRVARDLLRSIR
ncbi:MAG TPA: NAD(P)/FAD-dependent oxidoreductase [Clostridia bacterium]|nr:NAD(P)/FAD-dependent oxidoreductase [Clostridia bacterium]